MIASQRDISADLLFASVQTLGRIENLSGFAPTSFDYIIIDEFHHAAATTYRRIIDHSSTGTGTRTDSDARADGWW